MTSFEDALRDVDQLVDGFLATRKVPGVVYGIVRDGELVHSRGLGTLRVGEDATPDADSVFRIASMTKSFTAAAVLGLRDEGRLALDDPIAAHVPELAGVRGPTADSPPITIRHLLTMTAGLPTDDPWGDRQQGLDLASFATLLRGPLSFAWTPGLRFEYSNLGYGILGRLVTNVGGAEYKDVVRDRLLGPLGMTATTYEEAEVPAAKLARGYLWRDEGYVDEPMDPYGALASMGGVFTSVRDLSRWVRFLAEAFPPRDDPVDDGPLSRASRREMQQVQAVIEPAVSLPLDAEPTLTAYGYGFGIFVVDDSRFGRIAGHSGGYPGFGSNMRWHLASGLGVIVLANHRYAPSSVLSGEIMESILKAEVLTSRRVAPAPATVTARADVERLLAAWDDELASRLFAMNVELDEPLALRKAALERLRERHGTLRPDRATPPLSDSPSHLEWWLVGARGGRVKVGILLDPEVPPRVQTLAVTSVADPPAALQAAAITLVDAINAPTPAVPKALRLGPKVDRRALARVLRIAGARFAPVRLGPVVEGDGATSARWRLPGRHGTLDLALERDGGGEGEGRLTAVALSQRSPELPRRAD